MNIFKQAEMKTIEDFAGELKELDPMTSFMFNTHTMMSIAKYQKNVEELINGNIIEAIKKLEESDFTDANGMKLSENLLFLILKKQLSIEE